MEGKVALKWVITDGQNPEHQDPRAQNFIQTALIAI